jgi:hypothetical protein
VAGSTSGGRLTFDSKEELVMSYGTFLSVTGYSLFLLCLLSPQLTLYGIFGFIKSSLVNAG